MKLQHLALYAEFDRLDGSSKLTGLRPSIPQVVTSTSGGMSHECRKHTTGIPSKRTKESNGDTQAVRNT